MSVGDRFQLDRFNFATGEYLCISVSTNRMALREQAYSSNLKCWRIWNRTKRVKRDRLLPPASRIVKTFNHATRFSLAHRAKRGSSLMYKWSDE